MLLNGIILYDGKLIFANDTIYEGKFINNMYNGYGKLKNNYFKIKGNFLNNNLYGNANVYFNNINFNGEFINNIASGVMKITYDEYIFFGEMSLNKANGYGILKYNGQIIYMGNWKNNLPINSEKLNLNYNYEIPKLCKLIYSTI